MKSLCRKLFILLLAGTFLSPAMAEGNRYWSGRFRIGMRKTTVWIAAALFAAVLSFFSISGAAAKEVNLNSPAGTAAQPITSVNLLFNAPDGRKLNLIIYGVREGQKAALKNALESHYGSEPLKLIDAPFTDAEKYEHEADRKIDFGFCWACSISNMLNHKRNVPSETRPQWCDPNGETEVDECAG